MDAICRRLYLALFFVLASGAARAESGSASEKTKVGALLTLSGKFASAGEDCRLGLEAGLAASGESDKFQFVYADSLNDPTASVSEFRKLTTSDAALAVYTHRSSVGMALNPISASSHVPLLGAVAHEKFPVENPYAYQVCWRTDDEGVFVAREMLARGFKRIALLSTEDEYTSAVAKSFIAEMKQRGGNVVVQEALLPSDSDFRTILARVQAKNVDALYLDLLLPHIVPMVKQLGDLRVSGKIFGNFYFAKDEVRDAVGAAPLAEVMYADIQNDLPYLKSHLTGGRALNPPGLTVTSYVAALLIAQAVTSGPRPTTPEEFASLLEKQHEVITPERKVYRVSNRIVQFPLVMKAMKDSLPTP